MLTLSLSLSLSFYLFYLSISPSQLLKAVRTCWFLCMLTSKWTSRHNGVQFCISHLGSWLRARRCSELTCRPSGATRHWENTTFWLLCIFFLLTRSLLWSALFYSSLLSASSHLCFSSAHIVGSLISKLPSIMQNIFTKKVIHRQTRGQTIIQKVAANLSNPCVGDALNFTTIDNGIVW